MNLEVNELSALDNDGVIVFGEKLNHTVLHVVSVTAKPAGLVSAVPA